MSLFLPPFSYSLATDFYQLSMAYGYWKGGMAFRKAVFHHFFRRAPFNGGFTIAAGLEPFIRFLKDFRFNKSDIDYLATLKTSQGHPFFEKKFFDFLLNFEFACDIDAVPEGTVVFPYEPLVRVQGPLWQCQLLESILLNLINFPTLIATKSARVCLAAKGDPVFEFGFRRAQGLDGALTASRAAYIGGCSSTSNVLAGKLFGIPVGGTQAHSWIMAFEKEQESFDVYAEHLPENAIFLVDTFNTLEGVKHAISTGKRLKERGYPLLGIRLDSGDLAELSIAARKMLDEAGFNATQIYASNELDEVLIAELKRQGAKINVWGVGTHLVTGKDQAALDGVYKLSALENSEGEWEYKLKLSEQMTKVSNPGILQVKRFSRGGMPTADMIYDIHHPSLGNHYLVDPFDTTKEKMIRHEEVGQDLLEPIFREGKQVYTPPSLEETRKKCLDELASFPVSIKRFLHPHLYVVGMEHQIYNIKMNLIKKLREKGSEKA